MMLFDKGCEDETCYSSGAVKVYKYCEKCTSSMGKEIKDWEQIKTIVDYRLSRKIDNFEYGKNQ
jgi:hypothetical protein